MKEKKRLLLNGVGEKERNFKNFKGKTDQDTFKKIVRCRLPTKKTIEQLEKEFIFDLETYNDQRFVEAHAAGFCDVNRLRLVWWD